MQSRRRDNDQLIGQVIDGRSIIMVHLAVADTAGRARIRRPDLPVEGMQIIPEIHFSLAADRLRRYTHSMSAYHLSPANRLTMANSKEFFTRNSSSRLHLARRTSRRGCIVVSGRPLAVWPLLANQTQLNQTASTLALLDSACSLPCLSGSTLVLLV